MPTSRKLFICDDISVAITRWIDDLVDQPLRRRGGQHGVQAVGPAAHVLRGGNLVHGGLERCQLRPRRLESAGIGRVLGFGGLLHRQLVVQIQLGGVHRLGGLLGLPRQFIELCQSIVGGVGLHLCGEDACEERHAGYRTDNGSLEDTCDPVRAGRASRFASFNCRDEAVSNCS